MHHKSKWRRMWQNPISLLNEAQWWWKLIQWMSYWYFFLLFQEKAFANTNEYWCTDLLLIVVDTSHSTGKTNVSLWYSGYLERLLRISLPDPVASSLRHMVRHYCSLNVNICYTILCLLLFLTPFCYFHVCVFLLSCTPVIY